MLVAFCMYLSPIVLISSIVILFDFRPLNTLSILLFVRGDGLKVAPDAVGDMVEVDHWDVTNRAIKGKKL